MSEASAPAFHPTPTRTNALALVSLIAGILGLTLVPLLPSVVAASTGPMVRKQIAASKASAGSERGDGLAKAGMILGWLGILLGLCVSLGIVIALVLAFREPGMTPPGF